MNAFCRSGLNVALALDRLMNAMALGSSEETISARLGRIKEENGGRIPRHRLLARFLDWGLDKIEKDHVEKAHAHEAHEMPEIREESVLDKPKGGGK